MHVLNLVSALLVFGEIKHKIQEAVKQKVDKPIMMICTQTFYYGLKKDGLIM